MITKPASEVFRDYVIEGNPASEPHSPLKADIRQWGFEVERPFVAPLGMAVPNLVLTPVSGRLATATQNDSFGSWFITATDGSNESAIGGDYDLEHPFVRVGQPNSASDPNKPPGTVFNISANIGTATLSAFNVFDCNVYSNVSSTHGHYAGQFTAYSGPSCAGVGGIGVNVFNDNAATNSHGITVGVASSAAISGGDLGGIQVIVGQHGGTPRAVDFAVDISSRGTGLNFDKAIRLDNSNVISPTGTIFGLRNGTRINCAWGIDFLPSAGVTDATFTGGAFRSTGFTVDGNGRVLAAANVASTSPTSGSLVVTGGIGISGDVVGGAGFHGTFLSVASGNSVRVNNIQVVSDRRTGWTAATGTATRTTFATGSVTLPQLAERTKALIDDLIAHGLIGT